VVPFTDGTIKEPEQQTLSALDAQEKKSVSEIVNKKKPYCIGNYSIELPDGMVPNRKTEQVIRVDDMSITTQRLYLPSFE
jgi:hypothetical protein